MSNSITDRTFGIEIECFLNQDRMTFADTYNTMSSEARKNQSIYFAPDSYGHWLRDKWVLGYDTTIRSHAENQRVSVELTSCPIKFSELDNIKPILKSLKDGGATVNKSCGFHCHIDAKDLSIKDVKKIMINYLIYEEVIAFMHPYSRRWNAGYASSTRNVDTSQIDTAFRNATTNDLIKKIRRARNWEKLFLTCSSYDPRYVKLNIKGLYQYHTRTGHSSGRTGTIEFRQHGGTIDQDKIINWISFCYQLVESARYAKCDSLQNDTRHVPFARKKRRLFDKIRKQLGKGFDSEEEFLDSYLFNRYTESRKFLIKRISWFMGPANRLTESEQELVNRTRLNGGTDVQ